MFLEQMSTFIFSCGQWLVPPQNCPRKALSITCIGLRCTEEWSDKFTRIGYSRADRPYATVVEYKGDEGVAAQFPHGNARTNTRNYVHTQPHALTEIRKASSSRSAKNVYRNMVSAAAQAAPSVAVTAAPRNCEQVRNTPSGTNSASVEMHCIISTNWRSILTSFSKSSRILDAASVRAGDGNDEPVGGVQSRAEAAPRLERGAHRLAGA